MRTAGLLNPTDVPEVATKIEKAVEAFVRSRRFVCRHVAKPGAVMFLCAQHPLIGLRCSSCMPDHLDRHDQAEEHTCDRCRGAVDTIHAVVLDAPLSLPVRQARGPRGFLIGRIFVGGLGLCEPCLPGKSAAA
jgi:hypothetical protein